MKKAKAAAKPAKAKSSPATILPHKPAPKPPVKSSPAGPIKPVVAPKPAEGPTPVIRQAPVLGEVADPKSRHNPPLGEGLLAKPPLKEDSAGSKVEAHKVGHVVPK